jgi:putative ABC transport system permease protein
VPVTATTRNRSGAVVEVLPPPEEPAALGASARRSLSRVSPKGMSFVGLVLHNLATRRLRAALIALAVAISVMAVVTLGVVTESLRSSAAEVLSTGRADFTVAQKSVADVLSSVVTERQVSVIAATPGVKSAVGALVATTKLDADHAVFLRIGLAPESLEPFGVKVVAGHAYGANAAHEVMLGYQAAESLGKSVGDKLVVDGREYTIVGIYSTRQAFADSASMWPLSPLQAEERKPGTVTLAAVQLKGGADMGAVRKAVERASPSLATVRLASEFGRVDRNLQFLDAARAGAGIISLTIGVVIVMNTMLLSFVERIREFGVLRAVGWTRRRLFQLVLGEAVAISLLGAVLGVALAFMLTGALERFSALRGVLDAQFSPGVFLTALYAAVSIGVLAALYPAARAALIRPGVALRKE